MKTIYFLLLLVASVLFWGCNTENETPDPEIPSSKKLTIFFVNDVHAQIDNFAKVKHIVDAEKQNTNVIVASAGDLFSGNPVVDNYEEKGYPIIDVMNQVGFDVAVLGNHEFDYGPEVLKDRMEQSKFPWLCANIDVDNSILPQPNPYTTVSVNDLKITFLGLVETGGSNTTSIPSSHPWRVQDFTFEPAQSIIDDYRNVKEQEGSDLLVALSHLGHNGYDGGFGDFQLAQEGYYLDLIIGGHSHAIIDTTINEIPVFQSGGYLNFLGKIELTISNKAVQSSDFTLIDLNSYFDSDADLKATIEEYNNWPELEEVVGYSHGNHSKSETGCFYADALRQYLNADVSFQNTGGVRSTLNSGNITKREIFEISPFNNGTVIYEMTVAEIKDFLIGSRSGFYYSGIIIWKNGDEVEIFDLQNQELENNVVLKVGINDYIPAVHYIFFPDNGVIQTLTAAESIIAYLENIYSEADYLGCNRYFRY